MSQTTHATHQGNGGQPQHAQTAAQAAAPKRRRARSPSVAKPAFVIMQVLDDSGEPQQIDKKRIRVVAVERSAEKVMEAMEDGVHQNAFYLRVVVPAGTRAGSQNKPAAQVA